jgi:hypothetical protein
VKQTSLRVVIAAGGIAVAVAAYAASIDKALADTESRKKTAESGLRQIKKKAAAPADNIRAAYSNAAGLNNAWLEHVCQAVESGGPMPDTTAQATAAANALIEWVALRNPALEMPVMPNEMAENVKKSIARDLNDISAHLWKIGRDNKGKSKEFESLKERLRWNSWENVS